MHPPSSPITPVPLPMSGGGERVDPSVRTLLVVGGSFDPPHKAHVHLPLLAARHLESLLDEPKGVWLLYVPAARSPFKQDVPRATDAQRVEMLTLATGHLPRVAVWTDEVDRAATGDGGPSYTVDTLRRLREWLDTHGGDDVRLRLLIGADQAAALNRWREPQAVVALAEPLVMARAGDEPAQFPMELGDWSRRVLPTPKMEASSTAVRTAVATGDRIALAKLLDAAVLKVIERDGLYQPPGNA